MANWFRISGFIAALAVEIKFFPFVFIFLFVYNKKKSRKIAKFITNLVLKGVFLPLMRRVYWECQNLLKFYREIDKNPA